MPREGDLERSITEERQGGGFFLNPCYRAGLLTPDLTPPPFLTPGQQRKGKINPCVYVRVCGCTRNVYMHEKFNPLTSEQLSEKKMGELEKVVVEMN